MTCAVACGVWSRQGGDTVVVARWFAQSGGDSDGRRKFYDGCGVWLELKPFTRFFFFFIFFWLMEEHELFPLPP